MEKMHYISIAIILHESACFSIFSSVRKICTQLFIRTCVYCKKTVLSSERIKLIERWAETASRRNVVSKGEVNDILRLFPPDELVEAYLYEIFRPFLAKLLQRHMLDDGKVARKEMDPNYGARSEMTASTDSGRTPRMHGSPRPDRGSEGYTPAGFVEAESDIESIKLMEENDGDDSAV